MTRSFQFLKTLSDLSSSYEASAILSSYFRNYDPGEKIDYSDFSNHVFFNSAYNKYSIFLYKLFNFYDRTFSWDEYYNWIDDLSPYEKYCLQQFPSYRGYFQNSGSDANSYIVGKDYENKLSLTSSEKALTIEFCCSLSATDDVNLNHNQYIVQRGCSDKYYEVYLSSSNEMVFRLQSGTTVFSASCEFSSSYFGVGHHFTFCWSSDKATTEIYLDGVFVNSCSAYSIDSLILETGSIYIGCSSSQDSESPFTNYYLTGSIDELRIWNSYRTSEQIYEYYNKHIRWEPELIFYLKFNEPHYTMSNGALYDEFLDYSKRPITCKIINYSSSCKQEGVLLDSTGSNIIIDNYYDPMIFEDNSEVSSFVEEIWSSASEYDKNNRNIITDLIPYSYIEEETKNKSYNLINMLYIFARQLDEMKLHINGFKNFWKRSYNDYNVIPYNLLQEAIELFGFSSFDNFPLVSIDELYKNYNINETNILAIKEINELFWRNLLANIIYIYKTKGTRESIKSFFNCLGIDENVLSIKDYSSQYLYPISQSYVNKYKYQKILDFTNSSNTSSFVYITSSQLPYSLSGSICIETLCSFKPYVSYESGTFYETIVTSQPYVSTGSIWGVKNSDTEFGLFYTRELTSSYGNIHFIISGSKSGIETKLSALNVNIFDGDYYNICYRREVTEEIFGGGGVGFGGGGGIFVSVANTIHYLDINKLNTSGYVENLYSSSCSFVTGVNIVEQKFIIGSFTGSNIYPDIKTETRQTEVRLWDTFLSSSELEEHCMNYCSVGVVNPEDKYVHLIGHWILNDNVISDSTGTMFFKNYSYYKSILDATGSLFLTSSQSNFIYELLPYNYLCPDLSLKWNTNKVQYTYPNKNYIDENRVGIFSIEFNLIDSLNEDIIKLFSDMNKFSNLIGIPVLRNKNVYDLERYIKELYFTRLNGNISFVNYFNNLEWIDKFYFNIIEKLIPAKLYFIGEEKVIESHLLERHKVVGQIAKESSFRNLSSTVGR